LVVERRVPHERAHVVEDFYHGLYGRPWHVGRQHHAQTAAGRPAAEERVALDLHRPRRLGRHLQLHPPVIGGVLHVGRIMNVPHGGVFVYVDRIALFRLAAGVNVIRVVLVAASEDYVHRLLESFIIREAEQFQFRPERQAVSVPAVRFKRQRRGSTTRLRRLRVEHLAVVHHQRVVVELIIAV